MSRLLGEPVRVDVPKFRPYRGKPFTRAARRATLAATRQAEYPIRKFGFAPEIQPSTSSKKMRNPSERSIFELLTDMGIDPDIEPHAIKILRNGKENGQFGWFVPDFYVLGDKDDEGKGGTFIEVSMGDDLSNKLHKIRFVAERYGRLVIHITRDNIQGFIHDPDSLMELISLTRIEEMELEVLEEEAPEDIDIVAIHARLGTKLEPRIKIEKSRKPRKGKRPDPHRVSKRSTKPSRDPQRRAERRNLRKHARLMELSIADLRQRNATSEVFKDTNGISRHIKVVPSPWDIKSARVQAKHVSAIKLAAKQPKVKTSAGPKPASVQRINIGPQGPLRKAA